VRHQQHAALPHPRRDGGRRLVAHAAPEAATADPAAKAKGGSSGVSSGIKLENVSGSGY
jgi:hypothetical protein